VAEVQQAALQQAEELRVFRQAAAQQAGSHQGDSTTSDLQAVKVSLREGGSGLVSSSVAVPVDAVVVWVSVQSLPCCCLTACTWSAAVNCCLQGAAETQRRSSSTGKVVGKDQQQVRKRALSSGGVGVWRGASCCLCQQQ
jgi:hypothetical protein